ncbi:T9SS type A sorting domain-containing protein [Pontibacter cellulosilyticus]|uniref:T9SS type A sorting domain-containing protein n=1 Tax=Pontibacter cellulosilyticus TaxID=1720253 RepID=A0A923N591_9BACT|nr:T9SS type A sorting domain-containing protein [Pontibacter cellulosilyticus]MBC5993150.1 T9SS type A sorting domain-containing protein [Pontibacter cellulosilyticus]
MKTLLLYFTVALYFLSFTAAQATHIKGGYITHKADKDNPLKYHFELYVYKDRGSSVDDPSVTINFSGTNLAPNTSISVLKYSYTDLGGEDTALNIYKWEYTFPGAGTFNVTWNGINRNPYILNVSSPSDQLSFLVKTTLIIPSSNTANNGIRFEAPTTATAYVGKPFKHNLRTYETDGDILVYKFVTPLCFGPGYSIGVPNYSLPPGISINKFGEINWPSPQVRGEYVVAVLVEEYKNNELVAQTIYDFQIIVQESNKEPRATLVKKDRYKYTTDGMIIATPNQRLKLEFFVSESSGKTPKVPQLYSEFQLDHIRNFTSQTVTHRDSANGKVLEVVFTPAPDLVRNQPYIIGTKSAVDKYTTSSLYLYEITNWDYAYIQVASTLLSVSDLKDEIDAKVYPNPVSDKIFIEKIKQKNVELQIWNVMGQQVVVTTLNEGKNIIKRPRHLPSGTYFYYIISNGRRIKAGKLFFD